MKFSPSSSTKTSLVSIFVIMTSNSYSTMLSSTYFSSLPEVYLAPVLSLTQTSFKLLPLHWDSVCEILHMRFKNWDYFSYIPPALLKMSPTSFQSQMSWGLVFLVLDPWAREPNVGLGNLLYFSHLWVTNMGVLVLTIMSSPLWPILLCLLLCKILSASLKAILIDSCSVSSCNFGVSVGNEFSIFWLHHFGHLPYAIFQYVPLSTVFLINCHWI